MAKDFEDFKKALNEQMTGEWEEQLFKKLLPAIEEEVKGEPPETQLFFISRRFGFHLSLEMLKLYHQWMQEN